MKWPWKRQHPCPSEDAASAAAIAKRSLVDARNFETRASRMSEQLTETLRRNHFAAAVAQAMRGE